MSTQSSSASGGTSLAVVLTIVFVVLKLVGVIHWSWWWVLSPLWIAFLLGLVVTAIALLVAALATSSSRGRVRR